MATIAFTPETKRVTIFSGKNVFNIGTRDEVTVGGGKMPPKLALPVKIGKVVRNIPCKTVGEFSDLHKKLCDTLRIQRQNRHGEEEDEY